MQGEAFSIKTDFRYWLIFARMVRDNQLDDISFLFKDKIPMEDCSEQILEFYVNENSTPKGAGATERLIDYDEDGEYIYASFLAEYGIDLLDIDYLHWWKFKALLLGLKDDSKMKQIMAMRAYKKDNRSIDKQYEDSKRAWALPVITDEEEEALERELDALFYNA